MRKIMMMAMALLCAITTQAYTITVAEQQNCTVAVSPQQESYDEGAEITVTITPAAGAVFDSFEVYCECTESEWWEKQSYGAKRHAPAPRRASGFAYRAELYWFADDWEKVAEGEEYTFHMPARNVEIVTIFIAGNSTYSITKTPTGNGSTLIYLGEEPTGAATDAISATLGTTVNIRTTPNDGYSVDEVKVFEREEVGGAVYESIMDVVKVDGQHYSFSMPANPVRVEVTYRVTPTALTLYDDTDNSEAISRNKGITLDVTLSGRTLWKDGSWNTLCLPFDMTASQVTNQLDPQALMELDAEGTYKDNENNDRQTGFDAASGTLYLYFRNTATIEAGKPYIIKWAEGENLENPTFTGVTVNNATNNVTTTWIDFIGTYNPVTIGEEGTDKHNLYLSADNTLYYPTASNFKVNAFRAFFQLNGITAGEPNSTTPNQVRAFVLNFGNDFVATGLEKITTPLASGREAGGEAWYSLDGRKLADKPTTMGVYIYKGKKTIVRTASQGVACQSK